MWCAHQRRWANAWQSCSANQPLPPGRPAAVVRLPIMSTFQFQQFSVAQAHSAMKVCTDATLFGAMAPVQKDDRVLDIGAGTGLLSLMLAQLGAGSVTGVELTKEAFDECRDNFRNSPWAGRLQAVHQDIREFAAGNPTRYDLIISNPPFFTDHTRTADPLRATARHTDQLPYQQLLAIAAELIDAQGRLYLLLPSHAVAAIIKQAACHQLYLVGRTDLRGHAYKQAKVSALLFSHTANPYVARLLTIYRAERDYSAASSAYLSPFLLRFAQANFKIED